MKKQNERKKQEKKTTEKRQTISIREKQHNNYNRFDDQIIQVKKCDSNDDEMIATKEKSFNKRGSAMWNIFECSSKLIWLKGKKNEHKFRLLSNHQRFPPLFVGS